MKVVGFHGRRRWCALISPAGQQFIQGAGFKHRAGDDVRTDFRALFQQAYAQIAAGFLCHLSKANRGGETTWTAPDDDCVELHSFSCAHGPRSVHGAQARAA